MFDEMFENKKILIFCPHEDDEINLAGGLLLSLKNSNCDIRIIYSTNGDYFTNAKYRIKEAVNSLKVLGVRKENIIFLGYPDQTTENNDHLYMTSFSWTSNKGQTQTGIPGSKEYHYLIHGNHCLLNKENFIRDIYDVIYNERPDYIICVDYDSHADHRALSLAFEHAIGMILKNTDIVPIVLKAFAYPTSYKGKFDFKHCVIPKTTFEKEKYALYECHNPYYKWEDRLSFDVSRVTNNKFLLFNKIFMAISCHVSQMIVKNAYRIINTDQVFFLRRTDNLLIHSKIVSSSGENGCLNDFLLFDSSDIMHGNSSEPIIDLGYMQFDVNDKKKKITIEFDNKVDIEYVRMYKAVHLVADLKKMQMKCDGVFVNFHLKKYNDYVDYIENLNLKKVKKLELIFTECNNVTLTEIEAFSSNITSDKKEITAISKKDKFKMFDYLVFKVDDVIIFATRCLHKIIRIFRHLLEGVRRD